MNKNNRMISREADPNLRNAGMLEASIRERIRGVQARIAQAARSVNRHPDQVRLLVVTKGQPMEVVQAALAAGARLLGENYVEEALVKMQALSTEPGVEWHMIGHVQSRKADLVSKHFSCVHSVDSLKLAQRLDRYNTGHGRRLPVLLECNVSGEESKFGWEAWNESNWDLLANQITPVLDLPLLDVRGLMTMPPLFLDAEQVRPYFRKLRRLQVFLQDRFRSISWRDLSMGMSGDFEIAVQEGATIVRVGTAILGERIR